MISRIHSYCILSSIVPFCTTFSQYHDFSRILIVVPVLLKYRTIALTILAKGFSICYSEFCFYISLSFDGIARSPSRKPKLVLPSIFKRHDYVPIIICPCSTILTLTCCRFLFNQPLIDQCIYLLDNSID